MISEREYAEEMCECVGHDWIDMGEGWYQCYECGAWDYDQWFDYREGELES